MQCGSVTCGNTDVISSTALRAANQGQVVRQDIMEKLVSTESAISHMLPRKQTKKKKTTSDHPNESG